MIDKPTIETFLQRIGHRVALIGSKPRDPHVPSMNVIWPVEQTDPVDQAAWLSRQYNSVYVNLNPLRPAFLQNNIVFENGVSIRDAMIAKRSRVLIDIDGHGADPETVIHDRDAIRARFGPPLISTFSGHGWGLIYRVDFPNDSESQQRIKAFLAGLKAEFSAVDDSVSNAGRLTRLIGTLNHSTLSRILE